MFLLHLSIFLSQGVADWQEENFVFIIFSFYNISAVKIEEMINSLFWFSEAKALFIVI